MGPETVAKEQFEIVLQRADKLKQGWTDKRIAQYSDGIWRMEQILDLLETAAKTPETLELKRVVVKKLKEYHLERYKLLFAWMKNESIPHWQYEFEEWIKSFRAAGLKDEDYWESAEEVWKFSQFPVHPMVKRLMKLENKITVNVCFYRILNPLKTITWFFKHILFNKPSRYVDKYIDL